MTLKPDFETLRGRYRAYECMGRLYRDGLTEELAAVLRSVESLAEFVPRSFEAREAAADHYALFGLDLFAYAGAYLEADGHVGGAAADAALREYDRGRFKGGQTGEAADHIATELSFLAHLVRVEAGAERRGAAEVVRKARRIQRRFLIGHLLPWLPPFLEALRRSGLGFYAALADLTFDVVVDHLEAVGSAERPYGHIDVPPLPEAPDLLGDDRTGLKDLGEFLSRPAYCGVCITLSDVQALGRHADLPRGFGSRAQMLSNLLRSSAQFDRTAYVLDALLKRLDSASRFYGALGAAAGVGVPDPITSSWTERADAAARLIDRIRRRVDSEIRA